MNQEADTWPRAVAAGWHPLAHTHELKGKPLARTLMGIPVVLFRSTGNAAALLDRCPHRNVPLSQGSVCDGFLVCGYHGWRFNATGRCVHVPGAEVVPEIAARPMHVREEAGLVWVSLAAEPADFPVLPLELQSPNLDRFWWSLPSSQARLLDAVENLLDPAHPHCLHPNLVRRTNQRRLVHVRFRSDEYGGEARYKEEDACMAFLPRLFEKQRLTAVARYQAPTIAQLAFENDAGLALAITVIFSPEAQDRTRPFAHFSTSRGILPAWAKRGLLICFHTLVLRQDRVALAAQAQNIERFGGPQFELGPLDLFGPLIWRLANGRSTEPQERELHFWL